MVYGYARVSTAKQIIKRQEENIKENFGKDVIIFSEQFTGITKNRPMWQRLLNTVKAGDTIIFDSVSRMSRNADEGVKEYFELYERDIRLIFLNEPYINTDTYKIALQTTIDKTGNEIADIYIEATNQVLKILAKKQIQQAFEQAEKEVKDLQERTKKGMAVKGAGDKISKARTGKIYQTEKGKKIKELIKKHSKNFGGNLKDKEIIQMLNGEFSKYNNKTTKKTDISSTYYKYKKELLREIEE